MGNPAQLLLTEGSTTEGVLEGFRDGLTLSAGRSRPFDRIFLDTFDGRLHEQDLALFVEDGRLVLADADTYTEVASGPVPGSYERVLVDDLPPGELRDRLTPILEVRALGPVARLRGSRRLLRVCNADGKTVVRLTLESPKVVTGSRVAPLASRMTVVPIRDYPTAHDRVVQRLRELGLTAAERPLHLEAVSASGGVPGGISSKPDVALAPALPSDEATSTVLLRLLDIAEANVPGTIADTDSEFLHDLRVSVRRTRAVVREMKTVFPPDDLERWVTDLRWLQQVTGPVRDLDVHLEELPSLRERAPRHAGARPRAAGDRPRGQARPGAAAAGAHAPRRPRRPDCSPTGGPTSPAFLASRPTIVPMPGDRSWSWRHPGSARSTSRWWRWGRPSTVVAAGGAPRPAQEGQGAALPAGAVRQPVPERRSEVECGGPQRTAGRTRALPGQAGAGGDAAPARRRGGRPRPRPGGADGHGPVDGPARTQTRPLLRDEFATQFAVFAATEQRELVKSAFRP